jgi:hypothetical protein
LKSRRRVNSDVGRLNEMNDSDISSAEFSGTKKDKFDAGYKTLVDNYKIYLDNVAKSIASLSLILGWLVVSEGSRIFFRTHPRARLFFAVILFALFVFYALAPYDNYKEGNRIVDYLEQLKYIEADTYDRYKPKAYKTAGSILLTFTLGVLVIVFIWVG